MRLVGDPHLRNGVCDENVGAERRAATAACLLDGIRVRRYEGVVHHVMFRSGCRHCRWFRDPARFQRGNGQFPPAERNWGQRSAGLGSRGFLNWGQATWHCFRRCNATLH